MSQLTKDQVAQLTQEQQEALGALELSRVKRRNELLETARRSSKWFYAGAGALQGVAGGLALLGLTWPFATVLAVIAAAAFTALVLRGTNRRLDALGELLDCDHNPKEVLPKE
jgi:Flp pilus assembly protein TadB